ncbi:MAG: metallophosphoesterase family protein [Syntrophaceae bacterium]|nr:metallophosphoesterase family protein [Syntrophaceae bacterium]
MYTDPYLLTPKPMTSIFICWLTSESTVKSYVEFGREGQILLRKEASTHEIIGMKTVDSSGQYRLPLRVFQQIVHLDDLQPMTRYHYRAVSESRTRRQETPVYGFRTAPPPGTPVKFILLSDLQLKPQSPATVRLAGQQGADFIVYNGDLVNDPIRAGEWFSLPGTPEVDERRWFNVMQQTGGGCRLLQYIPIFPCPGNHEIDDQRTMTHKNFARREAMSLRIYMQLFRPLYPDQEYGPNGRHWYSADYGDLHLISLSVFRWFAWPAHEKPGWFLFDDIGRRSPQYEWLREDLISAQQRKYIWVSMHWHVFNRSRATRIPFTHPADMPGNPTSMIYDRREDFIFRDLKPLWEKSGVQAVSYGHAHVYERYTSQGIQYLEASSIGNTYRNGKEPQCSGQEGGRYCPFVDRSEFRSFVVVSVDPAQGMVGRGIQASVEADGAGHLGRVFDTFFMAARPGRGDLLATLWR